MSGFLSPMKSKGKHDDEDKSTASVNVVIDEDDRELEALGYVPSFKREFSNLATVRLVGALVLICIVKFSISTTRRSPQISFAFSIMV